MTQEEKLVLIELCTRLPYGVIVQDRNGTHKLSVGNTEFADLFTGKCNIKPYLRPLSSMTEEEAMEVAKIYGLKDILSVSVTENCLSVELDDGVAVSVTYIIWFNEIVQSIEMLDWLNAHYFDYRGLIPMGLGIDCTGLNIYEKEYVGVAESPLKTFPRVNEFECGASYRH